MSVHIRRRETGRGARWDVRYRRGGRYAPVQHAGTFATLKEANARKTLVAGWLAAGLDPRLELDRAATDGMLIANLAAEWLASRRDLNPRTLDAYRNAVSRVTDEFGWLPAEAVTWRRVNTWIGGLNLSPGTVRQHVGVLRMVLDHADAPNAARDKRVKLPRQERRVLDPPDAREVLPMLRRLHPRFRPLAVLLEQAGLRVSEALALERGDVDVAGGRVRVRPETAKTARARWVPCNTVLLGHLQVPLRASRQQVWNHLRAAQDLAGVRPFGPHMLRHRRATLWHHDPTIPDVQAAAWLGHSLSEFHGRYVHVRRLEEVPAEVLVSCLTA